MELSQHEQYEYARKRVKQKKNLYFHFVLFFLSCAFIFTANYFKLFGENTTWYIWAITIWAFLFILHFIKVFITDSFMNKNWERTQIDKLIEKQDVRVAQLAKKVESDYNSKK